jgi:hypothetical protein
MSIGAAPPNPECGQVYYSLNSGTSWTQLGGNFINQSSWVVDSITDTAFYNKPVG